MDKKTTCHSVGPQDLRLDDSSAHAQRARLLERLQHGPVNTLTARSELNILRPAAHIKERKEHGHPISAQRISVIDEQGRPHHGIVLYYLTQVGE